MPLVGFPEIQESLRRELGPRARAVLGEKTFPAGASQRALRKTRGTNNVLIHISVFQKVGKFDNRLERFEDWDFFWRVEKSGFTFHYAPQAKAQHVIPEYRAKLPHLREICTKNGRADAYIHFKYGGAKLLVLTSLWRICVSLGRDMPIIVIFGILGHKPLVADGLCALWYSLGFIRRSFDILVHNWFYRPSC
jgi:hypothetical protein